MQVSALPISENLGGHHCREAHVFTVLFVKTVLDSIDFAVVSLVHCMPCYRMASVPVRPQECCVCCPALSTVRSERQHRQPAAYPHGHCTSVMPSPAAVAAAVAAAAKDQQ
jgi:hypothetical protein